MNSEETVIKVNNLHKSFRVRGNKNLITGLFSPQWEYVHAVKDVNFSVKRGESIAFLGPNGAGKTTTTKMLSGIMHETSGGINVLGFVPQERKPEYLKRIGLVMGNKSGLNWDLTARQSYKVLKEIYQISDKKFSEQLKLFSNLLNISHVLDRQVRQLSLGERMKVELAAAILHEPEILYLDEPTIGLDVDAKFAVREFLIELQKQKNVTLILTSHDMDDIEHVCQRVLVINKGELIFDDPLFKLNNRYAGWRYMRLAFEHPVDPARLEKYGKLLEHKGHTCLLKVDKKNLVKATSYIGGMEGLADINIESVPLDKIVSDLFNNRHDK